MSVSAKPPRAAKTQAMKRMREGDDAADGADPVNPVKGRMGRLLSVAMTPTIDMQALEGLVALEQPFETGRTSPEDSHGNTETCDDTPLNELIRAASSLQDGESSEIEAMRGSLEAAHAQIEAFESMQQKASPPDLIVNVLNDMRGQMEKRAKQKATSYKAMVTRHEKTNTSPSAPAPTPQYHFQYFEEDDKVINGGMWKFIFDSHVLQQLTMLAENTSNPVTYSLGPNQYQAKIYLSRPHPAPHVEAFLLLKTQMYGNAVCVEQQNISHPDHRIRYVVGYKIDMKCLSPNDIMAAIAIIFHKCKASKGQFEEMIKRIKPLSNEKRMEYLLFLQRRVYGSAKPGPTAPIDLKLHLAKGILYGAPFSVDFSLMKTIHANSNGNDDKAYTEQGSTFAQTLASLATLWSSYASEFKYDGAASTAWYNPADLRRFCKEVLTRQLTDIRICMHGCINPDELLKDLHCYDLNYAKVGAKGKAFYAAGSDYLPVDYGKRSKYPAGTGIIGLLATKPMDQAVDKYKLNGTSTPDAIRNDLSLADAYAVHDMTRWLPLGLVVAKP